MNRIRRTKGDVRICAPEYVKWMLLVESQKNRNLILMMSDFINGIIQRTEGIADLLKKKNAGLQTEIEPDSGTV